MKDIIFYFVFVSAIVALFAFAFSFSQSDEPAGEKIFLNSKCNNCHTIVSMEILSKTDDAVDLSNAGSPSDAVLIKSYLLKEQKINDKEHKLKFKGSAEELDTLVNWIGTLKTSSEN